MMLLLLIYLASAMPPLPDLACDHFRHFYRTIPSPVQSLRIVNSGASIEATWEDVKPPHARYSKVVEWHAGLGHYVIQVGPQERWSIQRNAQGYFVDALMPYLGPALFFAECEEMLPSHGIARDRRAFDPDKLWKTIRECAGAFAD